MSVLSERDLSAALETLPGWTIAGAKLHREYRFADFAHAFGFMAAAAISAEAMEHHPEWTNVWNRVTIDLTTHDAGGITAKDIVLAERLEALAGKFS